MQKFDFHLSFRLCRRALPFAAALVFVLFMHGAVPGLLLPTLGQAVWVTGFSQSFINQSLLSIAAINFGLPLPAPIAFGLASAFPAGLLIAAGFHPADAYAAIAAIWLTVAFFGAWHLSMRLGLRGPGTLIAAVLWMSMPVTWGHAGYSSLSLGIALLPFYLWVALQVITGQVARRQDVLRKTAAFLAICAIAVFMDGYSYVMFAVGVGLLGAFCFIRLPELRRNLLVFALPVTICGFALSFFLYTTYIGQTSFEPAPLDFFRGWALDLSFAAVPTRGIHWLWDAAGLSVARSGRDFFGDGSVWTTTFSLPVIVAGLAGWWRTRRRVWLVTGFLIVALFGLYMALGPSLKVNAVRPDALIETGDLSPLMPAELAVSPTGSGVLSEHIPGFQSMRAAYRWLALGLVGFWCLIVLSLAELKSARGRAWGLGLVAALIVFNLPHFDGKWQRAPGLSHLGGEWQEALSTVSYTNNRNTFLRLEKELVSDMRGLLREGELVAFLPYRNDFLVNYLAARLRIRTYNIGGDKNVDIAREYWPTAMRGFLMGQVDSGFADRVLFLLARREADVVVLPYIDMLWAAHFWPPPVEFRKELAPVIADLKASGFVTIEERDFYAVVRIAAEYDDKLAEDTLGRSIMERQGIYPIEVEEPRFALLWSLGEGWYDLEPTHVWSGKEAELRLPIPAENRGGGYAAELTLWAYGARADREVTAILETEINGLPASYQLEFRSAASRQVLVPLSAGQVNQVVRICVPSAVSPKELEGSRDSRVLGVALQRIELVQGSPDDWIGTYVRTDCFR